MTDEIERRVTLLERRVDVFEKEMQMNHRDTARRLDSIEKTTNENGGKLDMLLGLKDKADGAAEERRVQEMKAERERTRSDNTRLTWWVCVASAAAGILGCLIEAHWQILP